MDAPQSAGHESLLAGSVVGDCPETSAGVENEMKIGGPKKIIGKQHSLQDLFARKKTESKIPAFQRGRSNSDGAALSLIEGAETTTTNRALLDHWKVHGDTSREPFAEESSEQKFASLALACTIDAATIKDRCQRQRRSRDQTENNFNLEVEKLKAKLALLQPLCTDFESADLLSTLYAQVETLTKAAHLVAIAAERYGAVQHEDRLTESVQLMVSHVQALKQQRDSARRQLQYTKRVLQEPVQASSSLNQKATTFSSLNKNKLVLSQRRASTDSVNFNLQFNSQQSDHQGFNKLNRRISEMPFRARPSRLDLGMELNKIKEMASDEATINKEELTTADLIVSSDSSSINGQVKPYYCLEAIKGGLCEVLRLKFSTYIEDIQRKLGQILNKWSANGYLHVFLNGCAIMCFCISVLTLASIFWEQDYAKGSAYWVFPWLTRKQAD